jgi:hypothetical protein
MSLHRESEVMEVSPKDQLQFDAAEIFKYWVNQDLRTPREYRKVFVFTEVSKQLVSIMKGTHSKVRKMHKGEILRSIKHFVEAVTNPEFRPAVEKKKMLKQLSILDFIYKDFNHKGPKSHLEFYIDPPKTLEHEVDPKLTKEIYKQFCIEKWGQSGDNDDIPTMHLPTFVRISNRLIKYLKEVDSKLQPLMGNMSSKNPKRAAYALIQANNVGRENFYPMWLANDISINNLDRWLKNQGYFKITRKTEE